MSREEEKAAVKEAAKKLQKKLGVNVGSAFGFPGKIEGTPRYFLIVWSNKKISFPEEFEGYEVASRSVPEAL